MQQLPTTTLVVTGEAIGQYAELTQDFNPLHLDSAFAATTRMGGVIAHGTMSINLILHSLAKAFGAEAVVNVDLDIRFIKPVRVAETLTAGGERESGDARRYAVWVRGVEGEDRLVGVATLGPAALG